VHGAVGIWPSRDGLKRGAHNISVGRLGQYAKFAPRPIKKVRVCSSEYLDHLIQLFEEHLNRISGLVQLLSLHEASHPPSRRTVKTQYDRLHNEPQILQKINVMRGHKK
jgi:hypothetical protein